MDVTGKEKYLSWGASIGLHLCLLIAAAAMGLFTITAQTEKRPIDVEIYDAAAPESAAEPAAAAAPPMPSIDDIPIEPPKKEETPQQEQRMETPQTAAANHAAPSTAAGTNPQPSAAPSTTGGGGDSSGRDADAARKPAVQPRRIAGAAPDYPQALKDRGVTGEVRIEVIVGADGSPQSVGVANSSGSAELDQAAVAAGYTYRYEPARNIYDEPVACRVYHKVSFSIK